jgi:hypothetical protein
MATRVRKKTASDSIEETPDQLEVMVSLEPKVELPEEVEEELKELQEEPIAEEVPKPTVIRWKKVGNGSFLFNNRYIKPGQVFTATVEEIPTAFRDLIVPVDKLPDDPFKKPKKVVNYSLSQTEDGKWNIVDKLGKVFNDSPMELNEAEKVLNVL